MIKGSSLARSAGKKAAETRKRNAALRGVSLVKHPQKGLQTKKLSFRKLDEPNYHKIEVDVPVDIFIHKKLARFYITPSRTRLETLKVITQ